MITQSLRFLVVAAVAMVLGVASGSLAFGGSNLIGTWAVTAPVLDR